MREGRSRHLVFVGHLWVFSPFMLVWVFGPGLLALSRSSPLTASLLRAFWTGALLYLVVRTVLAWVDPPRLRWDYVFPPLDVALISVAIGMRGAESSHASADETLLFLYFLPIAEAASTLNVVWAATVGALCVGGALAATRGELLSAVLLTTRGESADSFGSAFRLVFLIVMASLLTWLARVAAQVRTRLELAAEMNRIALEMHDGVQGLLITAATQLDVARRVGPTDAERGAALAGDSRELIRRAADELRFIVGRLRTPGRGVGFAPALLQYVQHVAERNGLSVQLDAQGAEQPVPPEVEHAVFRIVQESVTNVIRHARATSLSMRLEIDPTMVRCRLVDDGCGFSLSEPRSRAEHCGLDGMQERARRAGGDLKLESAPGAGTVVVVHLPHRSHQRRRKTLDDL